MKNILIEHARKSLMNHCMVKKFVGIYDRMDEEKGFAREMYLDQVTPTSIPKKMWAIYRVKRQKAGQLCLFN